MAVWETEDESFTAAAAAAASLPSSADTPYRTPSRSSKKSRRSLTPPGKNGVPPLPAEKADRNSKRSSVDYANDENISVLDPRRFTPNLHANLVSEILNLRRDQEDKTKIIESLESTLHTEREGQQSLQETLTSTSKENRSLKRQLALLEGGTSSALGELARERDEAIEGSAEVKKRLEASQKRLRQQEDDSKRVHDQLEKERLEWDECRRKYETKVHVAESRLRSMLEEVAAFQAAQAQGLASGTETESEELGRETNDASSIRTMSMTNSIRFSTFSTPGKAVVGHSLADELNFDGESDYDTDTGRGRDSALSSHMHIRNNSKDSVLSRMHCRNISNDSLIRPGSANRTKFLNQSVLERLEDGVIEEDEEDTTMVLYDMPPKPACTYVDAAVQYSPPPSPVVRPMKPMTPEPPTIPSRASMRNLESHDSPTRVEGEVEANQRRKRVQIARPMTIEAVVKQSAPMVSSSSQTAEPWSQRKIVVPEVVIPPRPTMVSISTQTDAPFTPQPVLTPNLDGEGNLIAIPSISIHPPTSRPSTPREPRLPQLTKDFGCQVVIASSVSSKSVAVQTEKIQMDERLKRLPAHLHPSAINSRPVSPVPASSVTTEKDQSSDSLVGNLPPRNPMRLAAQRSLSNLTNHTKSPTSPTMPVIDTTQGPENEETTDAYPGNNDDGPLSSQKAPIRRPHRISSLFAGFDGGSSDEADEFAGGDVSDSEFRTALTAPGGARPPSVMGNDASRRASGSAKRAFESPVSIKQSGTRGQVRSSGVPTSPTTETYSRFTVPDGRESVESPGDSWRSSMQSVGSSRSQGDKLGALNSNRASVMRKAVMIQNGIATHQGRSRSPSLPDSRNPPFPIPTRASSRRPPFSASAPSDDQRSPTRRHSKSQRSASIRKIKSAAVLPPRQRGNGSRSPPFAAAAEEDEGPLESPGLPPLPNNDITIPRGSNRFSKSHHRQQPSTSTAVTNATTGATSTGGNSSQAATGVVDAIAQTMVGEWMFKYVRRRKSFGVQGSGEASGRDDSSNDRHKRWVWLAPYERAILWSSKQPVSGSALLGKAGRKLVIQSVLDVKDDNPTPKGASSVFDRSILILTPQRALKFTATTRERHYVWLTALSFLAHSNQEVPEILASPPSTTLAVNKAPHADFELAQQKPTKRGGIRDSIRLAKGRTIVTRGGGGGGLMSIASSTQTDFNTPSIPYNSKPADSIMSSLSAGTAGTSYGPAGFVSTTANSHQRETSRDTAAPPPIPRFNDTRMSMLSERANQVMVHGRKRSNTGGHVPPPLSFRGFSGPVNGFSGSNGRDSVNSGSYHQSTNSTAGASVETSGSSGILGSFGGSNWGGAGGGGGNSSAGQVSQRTSEASSRPSAATSNNFFDAIGTVRMEAFISPLAQNSIGTMGGYPVEDEMRYRARRRSKEMRRRASRSRQRDSHGNRIPGAASRAGSRYEEDVFSRDDPFKGF